MFAPVGYTPLSVLWDQFLEARIDAVYQSVSTYYASDGFDALRVRGSPLDITEHLFCELMWKCGLRASRPDGLVLNMHTRFQDGVVGLFSQISPYRSTHDAIITQMECGNRDEIDLVAGRYFQEWHGEHTEPREWTASYPELAEYPTRIKDDALAGLKFHTLPICFERERYVIVKKLPFWARFVENTRDVEWLVEGLGGSSLCVPNEKLKGWRDILDGSTPTLDVDLNRPVDENKVGRPAKVPKVVAVLGELYPNGWVGPWKQVIRNIEEAIGDSVGKSTVRRAFSEFEGQKAEQTSSEDK